MLHAAIFDAEPVFTVADLPDSSPYDNQEPSDGQILAQLIPLLVAEQEQFQRASTAHSKVLEQLPELLKAAVSFLNETTMDETDMTAASTSQDTIQQLQGYIERIGRIASQEQPDTSDVHHLARACHLTLVVLHNLAVHRVPHRHISNQKYADGIFSAVRCIENDTWREIPYLRLWM